MPNRKFAPSADYWHLWADSEGVTHQSRCYFEAFNLKTFAPPSPELWVSHLATTPGDIVLLVLQAGQLNGWHRNPRPQWIVPLSGTWFVESMDGTRVEMGPGEVSFGEDQMARADKRGREGHCSGAVGNDPAVLMLIQVKDEATVDAACRFG